MQRFTFALLSFFISLILAGCMTSDATSSGRTSPYGSRIESERNPLRAQQLTMEAADILHEEPDRAEALLRQALVADLFHGPAHNNLGVIHLERGLLYEAANEFEWARKLMPGHPDPRVNLALTLERAGRVDEALATYESALEVYADDLAAMQGLARLQLRTGRTDDRTEPLLRAIALRSNDHAWQDWARLQLSRLP